MTIGGADAGNYSLTQPEGLSADIAAKGLTVANAAAQSKTYDGTDAAQILGAELAGVVGSDDVVLGNASTGTFAQAGVGTGIAVSTAPMTIGGADAGNYSLTQPEGLSADIAAKGLTVANAAAQSKTYDGTDAAQILGAELAGVVGSDDVVLGNASTGTFAQAGVGTGIAVSTAPMTIGGADAGNYSLTQPILSANIVKADQTIDFPAIGDPHEGDTVMLAATATSGNPVSFELESGKAILDGVRNVLRFTGAGMVSVAALQAGDGNWNPAPNVINRFVVRRMPLNLDPQAWTLEPENGRFRWALTSRSEEDPTEIFVLGASSFDAESGTFDFKRLREGVDYTVTGNSVTIIADPQSSHQFYRIGASPR